MREPAIGIALLGLVVSACGAPSTRDVRATILDESGEPIPGAVFYAEAYDAEGAFAFLWARAGDAGEVPDSAREPLKMPWRAGARIALAAFAPGRTPALRRDPSGRVESDGAVLVLSPASASASFERGLLALGFPFEDRPELASRAASPELAAAFRAGLAGVDPADPGLDEVEKRKIRSILALD